MKHCYFHFIGLGILLCGLLSSCNLYNPAEPVPAFIHIQKIDLTTDPTVEGTSSNKITDAWVYVDGKLSGVYELPVTLPVLTEGTHEILVKAGIKVNGISATRAPYPFYESYKETVTLNAGVTTTISPLVHYVSSINWASNSIWKEDFESASGMTLDTSASGSDTCMYHRIIPAGTTSREVFEGTGSGIAYLDHSHSFFEYMSSGTSFALPRGDSPVFLEFNYKSNYDFVVGMFAHSGGGTVKLKVINVHNSLEWNKIYVYLSPTISASGNATDFTLFFGMLDVEKADGLYMAIDNIKLVHY